MAATMIKTTITINSESTDNCQILSMYPQFDFKKQKQLNFKSVGLFSLFKTPQLKGLSGRP